MGVMSRDMMSSKFKFSLLPRMPLWQSERHCANITYVMPVAAGAGRSNAQDIEPLQSPCTRESCSVASSAFLSYPLSSEMSADDANEASLSSPNEVDLASHNDNLRESREELWYLKEVSFRPSPDAQPRTLKIITQNYNGSVQ